MNQETAEDVRALPLLPDSHPTLRRAMAETPVGEVEARRIARVLEVTMAAEDGIGLAANQVGLPIRAFAMRRMNGTVLTLFNPAIREVEGEPRMGEEGCLSFPGLLLDVERRRAVLLTWTDVDGTAHEEWMRGLDAVCAQHEIDHLNGIVFTSRVSRLVLERARRRLAKENRRKRTGDAR